MDGYSSGVDAGGGGFLWHCGRSMYEDINYGASPIEELYQLLQTIHVLNAFLDA